MAYDRLGGRLYTLPGSATGVFMRKLSGAPVAALLVGLVGCASTNPMLREVRPSAPMEVVDPAGHFRSRVSLEGTTTVNDEGDFHLEFALEGSEWDMNCFVLANETQLGVSAVHIADAIFEGFDEDGFEVSHRQIARVGAGTIEESPYQSLQIAYVVGVGTADAGRGLMKAASANRRGHAISCNHLDAGYSETFERVFEDLVRNFRCDHPEDDSFFVETSRVLVGGQPVGVETTRMRRDEEGDVQILRESSSLLPVGPGELRASHTKSIEWSTPDGTLINAYAFESDPDGEVTRLRLDWSEERGWFTEGRYNGKDLAAKLEHEGPLDSTLSQLIGFKTRLVPNGEETELTFDGWSVSADPSAVSHITVSVDADDPRRGSMVLGPLRMRIVRGEDGLPDVGEIDIRDSVMAIETISRRGGL